MQLLYARANTLCPSGEAVLEMRDMFEDTETGLAFLPKPALSKVEGECQSSVFTRHS